MWFWASFLFTNNVVEESIVDARDFIIISSWSKYVINEPK